MTDETTAPAENASAEAPVAEQTTIQPEAPVEQANPAPTEPEQAPIDEAPVETPPPVVEVSSNPVLIEWPRDEYGTCVDLKAAIIAAARAVRGDEGKLEAFKATMLIGMKHALVRFDSDKEAIAQMLARDAAAAESREAGYRAVGYAV